MDLRQGYYKLDARLGLVVKKIHFAKENRTKQDKDY
jgi:hypothetical protein